MDPRLLRLYVATFLFTLTMGIGLPLVPQAIEDGFKASVALVGIAGAIYGVTQIVMRLPMGDAADRYGRRRSLLLSFALATVAGILYWWAPTALWILPAQAALGFGSGVFWVAANSYLFDVTPEEDIPKATSNYAFALGLATLAGPPLGGALADAFGYGPALGTVGVAGLLGFLLILTLPELPRSTEIPPGNVYRRAWRILHHPDIAVSAVGTLLFSLVFSTLMTFLPVYLRNVGFTAFGVGILFAVRQGSATAVRLGLPSVLARVGPRNVLYAGLAVASAATAFLPLIQGAVLLGVVSAVAGVGTGVAIPANLNLVWRGAPKNEKGLANGIYGTALGLGSAIAPFVLGFVADVFGIAWTFWGAAATGLVGVTVLAAVAKEVAVSTTAAPSEAVPED